MSNSKDISQLELQIIGKVASDTAYKWSAVSQEDIQSELYVHFFSKYKHMKRYRKEGRIGVRKLNTAMRSQAHVYAKGEQAHAQGVESIDTQSSGWSREVIARALPYMWEPAPSSGGVGLNDVRRWREANADHALHMEHFSAVEELKILMWSMRQVFGRLTQKQQQVLVWKYRDGLSHKEIGDRLEARAPNVTMMVSRAVNALHVKIASM